MDALFSLRYAGSVGYYAAMLRFGTVGIDLSERYDKRHKSLNRMEIVGTNGRQTLSVPLQRPDRSMRTGEIVLSEHGNWRHNHWGALYSAYGRTPFFDYFADDLKAVCFNPANVTMASLGIAIHEAVVDFLGLPVKTLPVTEENASEAAKTVDMRDSRFVMEENVREYYQIWKDRHGFQPSLSILDLLFNVGREAIFYLKR